MILSDLDIKKFIDDGEIYISNFSGDLEPASYDLRVGDQGIAADGIVDIKKNQHIRISRGSTAVIYPIEEIRLSMKVAGRYGIRSYFARRGLVLLSGPQIDPGFEGPLSVTLFNAGTGDVILAHSDKFATIEFAELKTPASKPYSGPYQRQHRTSREDIDLITRKHRTYTEIEEALTNLEAKLSSIQNFVYVVLFGLITGSALVILQQLIK